MIEDGIALLSAALPGGSVGPYQLQAAIAALHDEAASIEDTDWPQILALYNLLERMNGSPAVLLNRTIALAMVHGPQAGLERLEQLEDAGRLAGHYRAAAERTVNLPERDYLLLRAGRLASQASDIR